MAVIDCLLLLHLSDVSTSGISQRREAWESQRKTYTADFLELDPCMVSLSSHIEKIRLLGVFTLYDSFGVVPNSCLSVFIPNSLCSI